MRLVFLGPPGAGKGTQADIVSERLGLPHISPGDMFRKAVKEGTPLGSKVKAFMDRGELVPDDVTIEVIEERISRPDCARGFILDGFPRNLAQAEALERMFERLGLRLDAVINFEVPLDILVDRSVGRRVCRSCGATYHVRYNQPRVEGVCDACGATLVQRDDDKEETVKQRLKVYLEQTEPLVDYYARRGKLLSVDGSRPVGVVTAEILKTLGVNA